jgi:hypothetical protein
LTIEGLKFWKEQNSLLNNLFKIQNFVNIYNKQLNIEAPRSCNVKVTVVGCCMSQLAMY